MKKGRRDPIYRVLRVEGHTCGLSPTPAGRDKSGPYTSLMLVCLPTTFSYTREWTQEHVNVPPSEARASVRTRNDFSTAS